MKLTRQSDSHDIEAELRRHRPEPRPAFVAALSNVVHERIRPEAVRRVALATILTVGMLTIFATFGGIGYASSAADQAIHVSKIERLVGVSQNTPSTNVPVNATSSTGTDSSGDDEYRPGKGCGDPNHIHSGNDQCNN